MENAPSAPREYGALTVFENGRITLSGLPLSLPSAPKKALNALLECAGAPVTRLELAKVACRTPHFPNSRSVDNCIARLRNALGGEGWRIQSASRIGYLFDIDTKPTPKK